MTLKDLMEVMGRFLEERGIRYFVFGAVAMDFWIEPRMTKDLDAAYIESWLDRVGREAGAPTRTRWRRVWKPR